MTKTPWKIIPGSITAPKGFRTSSVFCDVKRIGTGKGSAKGKKKDLAVICSDVPARVGGMFTTNQVVAAPVTWSVARARQEFARAVVVNSGNANACTGDQGIADTQEMAEWTARHLGLKSRRDVLVCSTGRIGVVMPMENVRRGIESACAALMVGPEFDTETATAIMTSDSRPKEIAIELEMDGKQVRIGGMTKGAGMIHPGMSPNGRKPASRGLHATMLCFVTTDVAIDPKLWKQAIQLAVSSSFNCISVDGDMSTNDSVIGLANGSAENEMITSLSDPSGKIFFDGLQFVCLELAKMIVRDGEGVTKLVKLNVHGGRTNQEADAAARAVANSELVKTSWNGGDPNWGRIAHALGYSSAKVDISTLDIGYSRPGGESIFYAFRNGQPTSTSLDALREITHLPEFEIHCHLHLGDGRCEFYSADLSEEYVDFNKGE